MRLSEKQKEVLQWGLEKFRNKSIYCPILKGYVYFSKEGIKHAIYYKPSFKKIKVFENIEAYLKRANKSFVEFNKENPDLRVFKLSLYATIDKKKYHIYIVVKENARGKYYYDSGVIKKV